MPAWRRTVPGQCHFALTDLPKRRWSKKRRGAADRLISLKRRETPTK